MAQHCPGVEIYLDTEKNHSFEHSFFPAALLLPLCVACLDGCRVGCCVVVRQGIGFRWLPLEGEAQQPTESWSQQYDIAGGDGVQNDHDGVGRYLIVRAIKLSDGKNQEQKYTMALGGRQIQIKTQQPTKNTWA